MKSSLRVEIGLETRLYQPEAVADVPVATDAHPELEIFVIFTDHSRTLAALRMADHSGKKLDARLWLLMPYEVPYALRSTRPAVPVGSLEEQLRALASKIPVATATHICLCRDKCRTVRLILKPRSIMILGGRKRWRPTAGNRLASVAKKRWASGDLRGIEVGDHAGFGLRPYRDIVVRCLLGCY